MGGHGRLINTLIVTRVLCHFSTEVPMTQQTVPHVQAPMDRGCYYTS